MRDVMLKKKQFSPSPVPHRQHDPSLEGTEEGERGSGEEGGEEEGGEGCRRSGREIICDGKIASVPGIKERNDFDFVSAFCAQASKVR